MKKSNLFASLTDFGRTDGWIQSLRYGQDAIQGEFLIRILLVWIQSFPFPMLLTSLTYYLHITGERTDGFMPFPKALAGSETQTALSRNWTLLADSISYGDNPNVKHASFQRLTQFETQFQRDTFPYYSQLADFYNICFWLCPLPNS